MDTFQKKNYLEYKKMSLNEIEQYEKELREYEYSNNISLSGMEYRKKIHYIARLFLKLNRILSQEGLNIIGDKRVKSTSPKIFACTHIGGNDIELTFEAIKDHAYLFLGDPKKLYIDFTGKCLYLNGVIACETNDKRDKQIAFNRSVELLGTNTNLLIYPEGAWNISRNKPVMKLFPGVAKMASLTGADIIPVAIEQYDKDFIVNIGENMKYKDNYSDSIVDVTSDLRDNMASLKWQIWEHHGMQERNKITEDEMNYFEENICKKCEYDFSVQDVLDTMYKDPDISDFVEQKQAKQKLLKR